MPEHVHLLGSGPQGSSLATAMPLLHSRTVRGKPAHHAILARRNCLPSQKFDVRSGKSAIMTSISTKKRIEKLKYMHRTSPVKRGLCTAPEGWEWSSYRTYAFGERGMVLLNQWPRIVPHAD